MAIYNETEFFERTGERKYTFFNEEPYHPHAAPLLHVANASGKFFSITHKIASNTFFF